MRGLLVTGTDTGVGKTIVAGSVAAAAAGRGLRAAVFKPAVTGVDDPLAGRLPDHAFLAAAAGSGQAPEEVAPYRFGPSCSPHLAARQAGTPIEPSRLTAELTELGRRFDLVVVEGVGGLLVPLTSGYLVRDLALDAGLHLVVVARAGLGTINHTLLTLEAARAAGLTVSGVVLTPWPAEPDAVVCDNAETLRTIGAARVASLPAVPEDVLAAPSPALLAAHAERWLPLDEWLSWPT